MSTKQVILMLSLAVLAACGFLCAYGMAASQAGYGAEMVSPAELYENPEKADEERPANAAAAQVEQTLRESGTTNLVSGILYQLRLFDTVSAALTLVVAAVVVLPPRLRTKKGTAS